MEDEFGQIIDLENITDEDFDQYIYSKIENQDNE